MTALEFVPGTEWPLLKSLESSGVLTELAKVPARVLVPEAKDVFSALRDVKPQDVKVMIIGQDPYINGEANGLAFSSKTTMTPTLEILFKELEQEGLTRVSTDLTDWAEQGVLLINTILTAEKHKTLAHKGIGWEVFTKEVARYVLNIGNPLVVMLWGRYAERFWAGIMKTIDIDISHIKVLVAPHPVAESRGVAKFTGCNHFTLANEWLEAHDQSPIKWNDR